MTEIDDLKEGIQKSISGLDLGTISKDPELAFIHTIMAKMFLEIASLKVNKRLQVMLNIHTIMP